jgi:ClpP class serine protease
MRRARYAPQGALAIHASSWGCEFSIAAPKPDLFKQVGALAIVDINGPLLQHADWLWDSYEAIRSRVDSALASSCETLVLRIDSPGGEVAGCFELSDEIRTKAKAVGKRVVAYVDGQAASAAYALACSADAICVPPTGTVGSIGCIKVALDQTGLDRAMGLTFAVVGSGSRKADGNPHVAMSEATLAAIQGEVDGMAAVFFDLVGRARGLAPEAVAGLEAAIFLGTSGVAAKLADQVITFDGLLAMLASGQQATAREGAEAGMDEKEKAIAALRALAASKDEKESTGAKAALKAMGVEEGEKSGDDEKKDDEKKDDDSKSKSEDDADKPKDEKKDDDKSDAKASLALAAKVQSLSAKWEAKEEAEERSKLMATRPDFAPEVVDLMNRSPLAVVRDAVKTLPRGATKAMGLVGAARAALVVQPVQGEGQGDGTQAERDGEPEDRLPTARELDIRMGLAPRATAIRHEGTRMILGVMTPAEARAEIAARAKGAAK